MSLPKCGSEVIRQGISNDDGQSTALTVWRKSLLCNCNGFTVIDSKGNLIYRVDNYARHDKEELVLMDAAGKPLHTMRRQKLSLQNKWLVFDGEVDSLSTVPRRPVCCVRKHMNLRQCKWKVSAHLFCKSGVEGSTNYMIEGSYRHRSCRVLDASRKVVMEIRRKETANGGISLGIDVFLLITRPGFDPSFAMAMVVLLDQMFS